MQSDNLSYCSASELLGAGGDAGGGKAAMDASAHSSLDANCVDIGEITESPDTAEYMSTSAILHYCKSKILLPYLKLLSATGLRPAADAAGASCGTVWLTHAHSAHVAALMTLGYVLQYMACFRRDRGFCYKLVSVARVSSLEYDTYRQVCYGSVAASYAGPAALHLLAFLYSLYLFRISDNEQLQNLMERVFLWSSYAPTGVASANPRRLLRVLWLLIVLGALWTVLSLLSVNLMLAEGAVMFRWMEASSPTTVTVLKVFLVICTLCHDLVQATVVTSYCLQAQLLQAHLGFLRERLLNRTITPLSWIREIAEFRKLLRYLNEGLAPAVCLFTVVSAAWAAAGALWLLGLDHADPPAPLRGVSLLNVLLWCAISVVPFVQAARLSTEGQKTQLVGHELAVRPFLHQDTPHEDIATVLMYASTLSLQAKLFHCPIVSKYLFILLTVATITFFALGMCHFLQ